ncbi:MAG: PorT family protein [Tannerella sp.]|jgi:hypothetical protein|nr:PorT family protein [Tannerella sp.]
MQTKKWLLIIGLAIAAPIAMQAQMQMRWGVKAGINFSHVTVSEENVGNYVNSATGYHLGPVIEYMQNKFSSAGIEAALLFTRKGFDIDGGSIAKMHIMNDYIEIPVNLKWRVNLPVVKPFLTIGPYVNFRVGGKEEWSLGLLSGSSSSSSGLLESQDVNAGFNLGAGFDIMNIQLGLNFNWGLTDAYKVPGLDVTAKDRTFALTAAVMF